MPRFLVTAAVTADVKMLITAGTAVDARVLFNENIMMTAGLADVEPAYFEVVEDSISDMSDIEVSKA